MSCMFILVYLIFLFCLFRVSASMDILMLMLELDVWGHD